MKLPPFIEKMLPPQRRARIWEWLREPERRRFRQHLDRLQLQPHRGAPVLNYADGERPDSAGLIHGGRVKLLHLEEAFPSSVPDFNLLYLVSSAPPKFALDLVDWARDRGAKLVWNQNGVAYAGWYGSHVEEINGPMRDLRERADFIFYQSEFCRACADRFLGKVSTPNEIAFNCVDTAHFQLGEIPDPSVCQLLVAGSHHESYRVFSALETVAELQRRGLPAQLHLAGRLLWAGAAEEVTAKIMQLGISAQVRRIPDYRQEDAPAIYQAAHILLHPKYKDPCPTVPIEAMACGVPVIGSASGGLPELVTGKAGVLLEVKDSWKRTHWPTTIAMADAVEGIMEQWPEYRAAARATAEARFSKERWVAQHRRVFEMLAPT